MFRLRNVATANVVGVLWAASMFAWFFLSALYMQQVLGYDPFKVGLGIRAGQCDNGGVFAGTVRENGDAFRIEVSARLRSCCSQGWD